MKTRDEARERAMELAIEHGCANLIIESLKAEGFDGLLDRYEVEAILVEADSIRQMLPDRPSKILPRMIGLVAVIMGVAGMCITMGQSSGRHTPSGYGIAAVILGLILIIKPTSAKTDI
jgi:hypothetical protein